MIALVDENNYHTSTNTLASCIQSKSCSTKIDKFVLCIPDLFDWYLLDNSLLLPAPSWYNDKETSQCVETIKKRVSLLLMQIFLSLPYLNKNLYRRCDPIGEIKMYNFQSLENLFQSKIQLVITKDAKPYMLLDYYLRCNNISVISQHLNSDEVGGWNTWKKNH